MSSVCCSFNRSCAAFVGRFLRESKALRCCTRVFTGINHYPQPSYLCHTCPNATVLFVLPLFSLCFLVLTFARCWFCAPEHQALLHSVTFVGDASFFCDCACAEER